MSMIARSDDLRRQNLRRILAALRKAGSMSRSELSASTGLSASTITLITAYLMERGALREETSVLPAPVATLPGVRRGRPKVALALDGSAAAVGVVALTLNKVSASIFDYAGKKLGSGSARIDSNEISAAWLRKTMENSLAQALEASTLHEHRLSHISLVVQGVTDADGTQMLWSPVTPLTDLPLASWFSQAFQTDVRVDNDCNMIANALRSTEPERFGDSFAAILLSHGIGMGLYLKGGMFTGLMSSAAEFGHMCFELNGAKCRCGRDGCIEAYAGDYAIWRAASGGDLQSVPKIDLDTETMRELAAKATAHNGPERAAYRAAGHAIGAGLRSLFSLLDPVPVAFAGSGVLAFELIEPAIREAIGTGAAGISHWNIPMHCYPDEFSLIETGALQSALTHVDNRVFGSTDVPEKELRHAI